MEWVHKIIREKPGKPGNRLDGTAQIISGAARVLRARSFAVRLEQTMGAGPGAPGSPAPSHALQSGRRAAGRANAEMQKSQNAETGRGEAGRFVAAEAAIGKWGVRAGGAVWGGWGTIVDCLDWRGEWFGW